MPLTPQIDIHPLTEAWFVETCVDIPESVSRKWLRHIVAETLDQLDRDELEWPTAGPARLTLANQALVSRSAPMSGGVVLHFNAAGTVIAIDLPDRPLSIEPLDGLS